MTENRNKKTPKKRSNKKQSKAKKLLKFLGLL